MSDTMSLSNSEWKEVKLENVVSKLGDGLHGTPKYDDNGEYYFVNGNNLGDGKITIKDSTKKTSIDEYKKYKKDLNDRTILVSINGTLGNIGIYNNEKCFLGKSACYFNVKENVEKLFIKYVVTNNHFQEHISVFANGTTIKNVSLKTMREYPFLLPPLPEQKSIAEVLSSLDDKIDLLHRQNKTLEQMAETLFRQWFVEEAKEDWEKTKIKDFNVVVTDYVANGSFASLKENVTLINDKEDYALFIRNTDLKSGFTTKVFVDEHSYNYLRKTKLFGGEIIISSVGDVGSVFRCPKFDIPMTLGNNVIMLNSTYNLFFYLFFKSDLGQGLIYGITSGSVQEKFNKTSFRDLELTYPSLEYLRKFETLVANYFDKIDNIKKQIRTLEKMRDTLLPKLMSGEVRIV